MSKYKLGFSVDSRANAFSTNREVIDLIDDYKFSEEDAKDIIEDEKKQEVLFKEWLMETIDSGFTVLDNDEDVEDFLRDPYQ